MPKIVDHAARREELARAVWRLIGRDGIEAATVRAIAAESQWSMGAVRHYFGTQDELLLFAAEVMSQRVGDRVRALYADMAPEESEHPGDRVDRACLALEQLLPMDADRTVEVLVWLALMTRARHDRSMDRLRLDGWLGERLICRTAVADALAVPLPRDMETRLDPEHEKAVDRVHVTIDGLSLQSATYPEQWSPQALHAAVRRLLTEIAD